MSAEQRRDSLRGFWLAAHRWLGLGTGILFAIAALTGAVLVYEHELESRINGGLYVTTPGDVGADAVLARVARDIPGTLTSLRWPSDGAPYYTAEMSYADGSRGIAHLDPGTGELAQQLARRSNVIQLVRRTHTTLLAGRVGHYLVLAGAVCALVSLVTGALLWWPAMRRPAPGFRVRMRAGIQPFTLDLHKAAGAIALPFLFVVTLTGVLLPFRLAGPVIFNIHTGAFGGAWVKPAYVMLCLTGAGLAASGTVIWWARSRRPTEPGERLTSRTWSVIAPNEAHTFSMTNPKRRARSRGGI